jgi:hypothetical protein
LTKGSKADAWYCKSTNKKCLDAEKPVEALTIDDGKWFNLYDQGLIVELKSGIRFVNNFRYHLAPSLESSPEHSPFIAGSRALPIQDTDDDKFAE